MSRYGPAHRAARRFMLPNAWGRPCARCGLVMRQGEALHLDHRDDGPGYLGMSHAACNVVAGAKKGRARQLAAQAARKELVGMATTGLVLAVEVSEDRSRTAVVAARRLGTDDDPTEVAVIEVARLIAGTSDALAVTVDACAELAAAAVVVDPHGSASWLRDPLRQALKGTGTKVVEVTTSDLVVAHQELAQHLAEGLLKVVRHPALDDAARAMQQRRLGGAFAPDRRAGDVAPIVAAELALWGLQRLRHPPPLVVL